MYCYYCGNILKEENTCTKCGREAKEIHINLDSLIVNQTSTDDYSNNEVFEKVLDDIIEKVSPADKKEESSQEKIQPKKVVVKVKPKKK